MKTAQITRLSATDYSAIINEGLADEARDYCMRLTQHGLKSHESRGAIRIGGLLRIDLGSKSRPHIEAMSIGATIEF